MTEVRHAVWLHGVEVGVLRQKGDYVQFAFLPEYWEDPHRPVLGLTFEESTPASRASAALNLPPWFSNLLPEGSLRKIIARDRGVAADREMELLAHVGRDLPGAVEVVDSTGRYIPWGEPTAITNGPTIELDQGTVKFSLAGVGLKFSMNRSGDRFTIPGTAGDGSQWIVKLPDLNFDEVPRNEFETLQFAKRSGICVPEIELVHRSRLEGIPESVWRTGEEYALAIRRFDRGRQGEKIHIEDFAQVRGFYPRDKYKGSFETVAALSYRGADEWSLREFTRRIVFNYISGNGGLMQEQVTSDV